MNAVYLNLTIFFYCMFDFDNLITDSYHERLKIPVCCHPFKKTYRQKCSTKKARPTH